MKTCSYSCVYCQLGRTVYHSIARKVYCKPFEVLKVVSEALDKYVGRVDYITFVGDGEPTLYALLGKAQRLIEVQGWAKTALISNASLIWRRDVMNDAMGFDFVSLKLDAPTEGIFRAINKPHEALRLSRIVEGLEEFSRDFTGFLAIEIMLVKNINCLEHVADLFAEILRRIEFSKIYLNTPIRPTSEKWVERPRMRDLAQFVARFSKYVSRARIEVLPLEEDIDEVISSASSIEHLLEIAKLHPLPLDKVYAKMVELLGEENARSYLETVLRSGKVVIVKYCGKEFIKAF